MRIAIAILAFAAGATVTSCKPAMLPGTNVEDTEENRKVIEFLGKYRSAVVEKSPDAIVGLCAKDYFEDNGTVDQNDDYGIQKLHDKLAADFSKTKEIHLELIVQQIERKRIDRGESAHGQRRNALDGFPAPRKVEGDVIVDDLERWLLGSECCHSKQ